MSETLLKEPQPVKQQTIATRASLRIAMVCARAFPFMGGIESHVHEVSSRLAALGHKVVVITTDPTSRLPHEETVGCARIKRVPAWPSGSDYYVAPAIYREMMSNDFDVAHIQGYHTFVAPLAMMAAIRKGVPFVITYHSGGHSSRVRNALRHIQWRVLTPLVRRASRHIGVSEFEAEFFSRKMGVSRDRFAVVPNGAELPVPPLSLTPPKTGRLIISAGRLERYKGHHRAIEAMHKLQWRFPDVKLMILGSGPYENELRKLVRKLRIIKKVTIHSIPPADRLTMAALMSSADLVVLLSEYEANPVAVMEALASGRKVLTSDTSGFPELEQKGLIRTVSLKSSPVEIAAAMAETLETPAQPAQYTLPTWDDCTRKLNEVYMSVVRKAA